MARTPTIISPSQPRKKRKSDSSPTASTKNKNKKKKKPTKKNKKEKTLSRSLSGSSVASICNSLSSIQTNESTDLSNPFRIPKSDKRGDTDTWTKVIVTKHVSNPNLDSYTMEEMRSKNGPRKTLHNFLKRNSASSHWEAANWKKFIDNSLDKYGSKEHPIV
jgi:hypothetical protein